METIKVRKMQGGFLVPIGESYQILGTVEYEGVGRVLAREQRALTIGKYNVAKIVGERTIGQDVRGQELEFDLETLPASVQKEIYDKYFTHFTMQVKA